MTDKPNSAGLVLLALAYCMAFLSGAGFYYAIYLMLACGQEGDLIVPFVIGAVAAVAGIGFTFAAVLKRTSVAGEHILFDTWFPMFMSAVPVAGPFIALWSAVRLIIGRLGSATITSSSGSSRSTRHHKAMGLRGSGLPGGLILLVLASMQPLIVLSSTMPVEAAEFLGISPIENSWDGRSDLFCNSAQIFKAKACKIVNRKIVIRENCQLQIEDCELHLEHAISVQAKGRLSIKGGHLKSKSMAIRAEGHATVFLESLSIKAKNGVIIEDDVELQMSQGKLVTDSAGLRASDRSHASMEAMDIQAPNAVKAEDESTIFIIGGKIHGKTALFADDNAVITLRGVDSLGKVRKSRKGYIHQLEEGESSEAIVKKARGKKALAQTKKDHIERYQKEACKGFIECYQSHGLRGEISGDIVMLVGDKGAVTRVRKMRIGPTKPEIKKCIKDLAASKKIPNFGGPIGILSCKYSGTVTPDSKMLEMNSRFIPSRKSDLYLEKVE
ncbi:MAG: hypothetical protein JRF33_18250 [Deltaproteobacteria bacterium]|nr:hypothetical protein [Deltaproteobacteria bacterium]